MGVVRVLDYRNPKIAPSTVSAGDKMFSMSILKKTSVVSTGCSIHATVIFDTAVSSKFADDFYQTE